MDKARYSELIQEQCRVLPDYVSEFAITKRSSVKTMYQYVCEIRRFFEWLIEAGISNTLSTKNISLETLEKLQKRDVELYIDYLQNRINYQNKYDNPRTINRSINALRSLFKFLTVTSEKDNGEPYFYRNVMQKVAVLPESQTLQYRAHQIESKIYSGEIKHDFLAFLENEDGYEAKLKSNREKSAFKRVKDRNIAIIALMLGTGVRVSEAVNVNMSDLDVERATLQILRKGGQLDAVPIAEWCLPHMEAYLQDRKKIGKSVKPLFVSFYAKEYRRLSVKAVENFIATYSSAFGRPITPHKLRHTLATELYEQTKDLVLVSQQLGQRGTSATKLYTHVGDEKQRNALNKIK